MVKIGLVGLGGMGANMGRRARRGGGGGGGWDRKPEVARALAAETGLTAVESLPELIAALSPPRIVWLMLPSGEITERHLEILVPLLARHDLLVDGANSYYKDSMRRAGPLAGSGIAFVHAGVCR